MLNNPVTMPEFKKKKKLNMRQRPISKYKSASQAFLTPQKIPKKRK